MGNEDLLYSLYVALPTNLLIMRRAYGRGALAVERRCGVENSWSSSIGEPTWQ